MQTLELDLTKRYTYADYLTWLDNQRRELYNGFIKLMSPAPRRMHQNIAGNLYRPISNYLFRKNCKVYFSPFDVRLPIKNKQNDSEIYTVVQPDLCIICNPEKLDDKGCIGAPDMIIEIISKSSAKNDAIEKYKIYEEAGVLEYWIVYPETGLVHVFLLENGKFQLKKIYASDDKIEVHIFKGELIIDLNEIFENQ